jgi:heme exporter protein CcmD
LKDHGFYILMSYGVFAGVVLIELYALHRQRKRVLEEAERMEAGIDSTPEGRSDVSQREPS